MEFWKHQKQIVVRALKASKPLLNISVLEELNSKLSDDKATCAIHS
jgi:hypothetical protein